MPFQPCHWVSTVSTCGWRGSGSVGAERFSACDATGKPDDPIACFQECVKSGLPEAACKDRCYDRQTLETFCVDGCMAAGNDEKSCVAKCYSSKEAICYEQCRKKGSDASVCKKACYK